MIVRIIHDRQEYTAHIPNGVNTATSANGMTFVCQPGGMVDVQAEHYQGFGSWVEFDLKSLMRGFLEDNVDLDLFTNDDGEIDHGMLATSTADAHNIYEEDGNIPSWLMVMAAMIMAEWRESHA